MFVPVYVCVCECERQTEREEREKKRDGERERERERETETETESSTCCSSVVQSRRPHNVPMQQQLKLCVWCCPLESLHRIHPHTVIQKQALRKSSHRGREEVLRANRD